MTALSSAGARVLLIATAEHRGPTLSSVPSVARSFQDLKTVLLERCGVTEDRLQAILDPPDAQSMALAIAEEAHRAETTLMVYFIGHGLLGPDGDELYLAASSTDRLTPGLAGHQALSFSALRQAVLASRAPSNVVVLDCCFSGRVSLGAGVPFPGFAMEPANGLYLVGSAEKLALAPANAVHTAFTGEVIRLLTQGDPRGPHLLTLDAMYDGVFQAMRDRQGPLPRRQAADRSGNLVIARNPAAATQVDEAEASEPVDSSRSPYPGLAAYAADDADVFFGREDMTERLLTAAATGNVVVLVGPSGSGKTSVLNAGLLARFHDGALPGSAGWPCVRLTPGESPLRRLATQLGDGEPDATTRLRQEPAHAAELVRRLLAGRPARRLVMIVDQLEELYALCPDPAERAVFLDAVLAIADAGLGLVVFALRADFYGQAAQQPVLVETLRSRQVLIEPMNHGELRSAIEGPAQAAGLTLDGGLADVILHELGPSPANALPLLSHAMWETWRQRRGSRLTVAGYRTTGGIAQAIAISAEEAWRECVTPGNEAEARRLLSGLVQVLPGGEAPLRRVLTREEAGVERWRLAQALAERRLLVLYGGDGRQESVELAHEALITAWPALAEQVRADASFLAGRAEVQHDLERWRKADGSADLLPGTVQLAALETRLRGREADLTTEQREFLAQARRRQRAQQIRVRAGWVAVALVLALIAGLGTFLMQESKVSAQREAEGRSRALAVQSDELSKINPGSAALAALAAYQIAPTQEARSALMRRYLELKDAAWTLAGAEGPIAAAAMSTDGTVTLATTDSGRATLFLRTAEGTVRQEQLRLGHNVLAPVVSRDGRRIAYLRDGDGVAVWHDVTPSGERLVGPAHTLQGALKNLSMAATWGSLKIMDFSPDARLLMGVSAANSKLPVQVWDLETGQPRTLPQQISGFTDVWFGSDENTLVAKQSEASAEKSSMVAVDIRSGTTRELASVIESSGNGVSGDGSVIVVCRREKPNPDSFGEAHYQAIRVTDGQVLRRYRRGDDTACQDVAIAENGERFAVLTKTGEWDVVDTAVGQDGTAQFFGPTFQETIANLPLLGTAREPVVVTRNKNRMTGWAMAKDTGESTYSPPKLLGDGSTMVIRIGRDGDILRVMETEGDERTLAEVNSDAETPPDAKQDLQVNRAETLVADVSDHNRITVRALPSLRQVAEFTAARPPVDGNGKPELLEFRFYGDDQLVTVSGTRLEYWDAHDGRQLTQPIDLRDLRLTTTDQPTYFVGRHPEPGYATVTVAGEPDVHAINLHTGQENEVLRVRLGDDLNVAVPLEDSRYAAVMTTGGMVELWSAQPGQPSKRVAGPLGPLNPNRWTAGLIGDSGFFLANKNSVRFLKADDPDYRETYVFAEDQGFLAAANEGKVLLRSPVSGGRVDLLRLDPALWQRHLCSVLGRNLTDDERSGLSRGLPTKICLS